MMPRCSVEVAVAHRYRAVVDEIAGLAWASLSRTELIRVAWAYYFFSVQFRESLEHACDLHPWDHSLQGLREGECDTDNLSPFPGIAEPAERMNHDEFMRRILVISGQSQSERVVLDQIGQNYLSFTRSLPDSVRAMSIASYEDGGLEAVFTAILRAQDWVHPSLAAFRHFLVEHIRFDSDTEVGHGALCRHLEPDDRILPLWTAFRDLLTAAVPTLRTEKP
jgi:hypothetical protein